MARIQRHRHLVTTAWIFVTHQIFLFPLVCSFSHIIQPKTTNRRHRRDHDAAPQLCILDMTAMTSSTPESYETPSPSATVVQPDEELDMPWSDVQEWALKDNLAKFTVIITPPIAGGKPKRYAMWRTLTREVPELAGYPIPFLLQMHQRSSKKDISSAAQDSTPGFLPMVDDFEFTSDGGIAGRAYGLPGIADGTRVETPSLVSAERTVPLGYVTTRGETNSEDGVGFSYELGTCASSTVSAYSSDGTERSAALEAARRLVVDGVGDSTRQLSTVAKDAAASGSGLLSDAEANKDLAYLGGATAMLLASATAVGMLSHHLTVNVFWV